MKKIIYRKTLDVHKNGIQFTLQGVETADKISRQIEISLMASGKAYDLPLEGVVALMYITTPNADEPSIEECTIRDNVIVYDVMPIVRAGITEMQLKLIGTSPKGAKRVLISPRFAVEVVESEARDEGAEQTTSYTALENAVAKASAIYDGRITSVGFVDDRESESYGNFFIDFANGNRYQFNLVASFIEISEDDDFKNVVKNSLSEIRANDVRNELLPDFGTAKYESDVTARYDSPRYVEWDNTTSGAPYTEGKTDSTNGFGIVYGDTLGEHIAVLWTRKGEVFVRKTTEGNTKWNSYFSTDGGILSGDVTIDKADAKVKLGAIHNTSATEVKHDSGVSVLANENNADGTSRTELVIDTKKVEDMARLKRNDNGTEKEYVLYGTHNVTSLGQVYYNAYSGAGTHGSANPVKLDFEFDVKCVIVAHGSGTVTFMKGRSEAIYDDLTTRYRLNVSWTEHFDEDKQKQIYTLSWYSSALHQPSNGRNANAIQLNVSGSTYNYIAMG